MDGSAAVVKVCEHHPRVPFAAYTLISASRIAENTVHHYIVLNAQLRAVI